MSEKQIKPVITYRLQGPYSYERITEPDIEYVRSIREKEINEWLEHAFQLIVPYSHVRLTLEVME